MTNDLRKHGPAESSSDIYRDADTDARMAFDARLIAAEYQKRPEGYVGKHRKPE